MVRLLVVADEVDNGLTVSRLRDMRPALVISCGDLPPDYLDFVASAANASLLYVPGNHDPDPKVHRGDYAEMSNEPPPPPGTCLDSRIVAENGLRIAGLGGSVRYAQGRPNQYTQREMRRRARWLVRRERLRRFRARPSIDLLVTHAPPKGLGDDDDPAHEGFAAFHYLVETLQPRLMVHGHIHPHGFVRPDRQLGRTRIVNAIPHRLLELD